MMEEKKTLVAWYDDEWNIRISEEMPGCAYLIEKGDEKMLREAISPIATAIAPDRWKAPEGTEQERQDAIHKIMDRAELLIEERGWNQEHPVGSIIHIKRGKKTKKTPTGYTVEERVTKHRTLGKAALMGDEIKVAYRKAGKRLLININDLEQSPDFVD